MGRRRTFIESEAISSATAVFAERGFAGASVDDLVRATGVNRASLYGVFGSKDGLFQRCLTETLAALSPTAAPGDSTGVAGAGREELDLVLVALMEIAPGRPCASPRGRLEPGGHHRRGAGPTPAGAGRHCDVELGQSDRKDISLTADVIRSSPAPTC